MKILVFSDSHRILTNMEAVYKKLQGAIDSVIHLGDCVEDAEALLGQDDNTDPMDIYIAPGNCDFSAAYEKERLVSLGGKKVFITHGHAYSVKFSYDRIIYRALELGADACLFGHTHFSECFCQEGILILNPGSISLPRGAKYPSYGVLDIDCGGIRGSIVEAGKQFKLLRQSQL